MTMELANEPPRRAARGGGTAPMPANVGSAGSHASPRGHARESVPGGGPALGANALALCSPALTVSFHHVGPICRLSLTGALTADTLGIFESQIDRLGRTACVRVVIDAAGLNALDETAARVLTGLHHYVEARGGRMTVAGGAGGVARMLEGTPLLAR